MRHLKIVFSHLKQETFLSHGRPPKVSCFPFNLSSHYHIYVVKSLSTSRDDFFENLPLSWQAKCSLPVSVRGSKSSLLLLDNTNFKIQTFSASNLNPILFDQCIRNSLDSPTTSNHTDSLRAHFEWTPKTSKLPWGLCYSVLIQRRWSEIKFNIPFLSVPSPQYFYYPPSTSTLFTAV